MHRFILITCSIFCMHLVFAENQQSNTKSGAPAPQKVPVEVVVIKPNSTTVTLDLPGRVSPYRTAEVRARTSGIINKRVFVEGSRVKKGEVLFILEHTSLDATLQARAADTANARAAYNLSNQTLKRYQKLLKMGAVSRQEYDNYMAQVQQSKAQVDQAKANQRIAQINLEYATVKAPISGRIDQALVTEGALASADITQLAVIEQIDQVYIDFTRSSTETEKLRKLMDKNVLSDTQKNDIVVLSNDGTPYKEKAQLGFSSQKVDRETGAIALRAVMPNPDHDLLPGMFVRVKVPVADASNFIKVPQKAVHIGAKDTVVYTVKDNKLVRLPVDLGPMFEGSWVIKSGVNIGDRIVTSDITIILAAGLPVVGMTAKEMQAMSKQKK